MNVKEYVTYIDSLLNSESKDINGLKNSIDMFFEFYKKNESLDADTVFFLSLLYEKMKIDFEKLESEKDRNFMILLIGVFYGTILGKFSERIKVDNYAI